MVNASTDIDIDFADREQALSGLMHVAATRFERNEFLRHPSGVYFQEVPIDPFTGWCSVPYEKAQELGYFKIDFLNNSIYQGVRDEAHLDELLKREPEWSLLEDRTIVSMLAHIGEHFGTVQTIRPKSIEDLALVLALIRPGKRHLTYMPREMIEADIWKPNPDGYVFKKSHSVAYAVSVVVQMNLLVEQTVALLELEQQANS